MAVRKQDESSLERLRQAHRNLATALKDPENRAKYGHYRNFWRAVQGMEEDLREKLKGDGSRETAEFMIWTSEGNHLADNGLPASGDEADTYRTRWKDFAILIDNTLVQVRSETDDVSPNMVPVPLEPRVRRLLVMLLRFRGRELDSLQAYRKSARSSERLDYGTAVRRLDPSIRVIKREITERVSGFEGPGKRRGAEYGYMVDGDFSFCIIMPEVADRLLYVSPPNPLGAEGDRS